MKKVLFILTIILALGLGSIVGICGDDYPDPWSVEPIPTEVNQG